jgi:excisionase family DNA binding protein
MKPQLPPRVYSITEVARILGVSRPTVYRYIRDGAMPVLTIGKKMLVPRAYIDGLVGRE